MTGKEKPESRHGGTTESRNTYYTKDGPLYNKVQDSFPWGIKIFIEEFPNMTFLKVFCSRISTKRGQGCYMVVNVKDRTLRRELLIVQRPEFLFSSYLY